MSITTDINPRWLDLSRAAQYTSMSKKTLLKHIEAGEIYASLKGGKWFVDKESIDAWHLSDKVRIDETVAKILHGR